PSLLPYTTLFRSHRVDLGEATEDLFELWRLAQHRSHGLGGSLDLAELEQRQGAPEVELDAVGETLRQRQMMQGEGLLAVRQRGLPAPECPVGPVDGDEPPQLGDRVGVVGN